MTTNALNNQCLNDFTVTSSTNGIERILRSNNTVDAAGSAATVRAQVQGGSSGDPKFQSLVSAVTTWSFGLDNSDGDALILDPSNALGTTVTQRYDSTGVITYPLQSAFSAYLASAVTNKSGNGANYTLGTDALTEIFDQNADFNVNGTFTAPVTGRYYLSAHIVSTGWSGAANTVTRLTTVTSNRSYASQDMRPTNTYDLGLNAFYLCDMDAGDTAYVVWVAWNEASDLVDLYGGGAGSNLITNFCGYLAC